MALQQKKKWNKIISAMIIVLGVILMAGKMYADSEPGLIPLVMIVAGSGWFYFSRRPGRSAYGARQ